MKKLLGIVVLGLMLCSSTYSDDKKEHIIHISCKNNFSIIYDKDRNGDKSNNNSVEVIRSFDLEKQILLDTNFNNNKPVVALINDELIYWHILLPLDDKKKRDFKIMYEEDLWVYFGVFEINRYTGKIKHNIYGLDQTYFLAYSGAYVENNEIKKSKFELNTHPFLKNAKEVLDNGLIKTKHQIPQKEIIHFLSGQGDCKKVNKDKKF